MLDTVKESVLCTFNVLTRIKELAEKAPLKPEHERLFMQVELSALVGEIDRIASQTTFNGVRLLSGDFSRVNPYASLWFNPGDGSRINLYISTITAVGLGLRHPSYETSVKLESRRKDVQVKNIHVVSGAILKVEEELKHIEVAIRELAGKKKADKRIEIVSSRR